MSAVFNFRELIRKNKTMARNQWDILFGACIPDIDYEKGDPIEKCIDQFESWAGRYPEQFQLYAKNKTGYFNSIFLCKFAGFRRLLCELKEQDADIIGTDFKQVINVDEFNFSIDDLEQVYQILYQVTNKIDKLKFNIKKSDYVVSTFGLDKSRDVYFNHSRILAAPTQT